MGGVGPGCLSEARLRPGDDLYGEEGEEEVGEGVEVEQRGVCRTVLCPHRILSNQVCSQKKKLHMTVELSR